MKAIKLKRIHPPPIQEGVSLETVADGLFFGMVASQFEYIIAPIELVWEMIQDRMGLSKGEFIEINPEYIKVQEEDEEDLLFLIAEINDFKVYFYDAYVNKRKGQIHDDFISRIQFKIGEEKHCFYFKSKKKRIRKLCENFYDHRVKFKEYHNGRRVFLGKQPKFSEVQKLKEKYGIDW